ncbi:MAG: taurine dioxygenase [Actinomycetota bacterium]
MITSIRSDVRITPVTRAIGAVVEGVDLRDPLDDDAVAILRAAVLRHGVVFLREQSLDAGGLETLASRFGRVAVSPLHTLLGTGKTASIIQDDAQRPPASFDWHTDLSWTEAPPAFGFLEALEIPPFGGDTIWATLAGAFARLSPSRQLECAQLRGAHAADASLLASVERHHGGEVAIRLHRAYRGVTHPLVRRHPETGAAVLFLSPLYMSRIVGAQRQRGERMLRELEALLDDPLMQVRWRWRAGDVAIWDEAATCHRALGDHFPQRRVMRRCVVEGSAPLPAGQGRGACGSRRDASQL